MKIQASIIQEIRRSADVLFIYQFVTTEDFNYNKVNKDKSITPVVAKKGDVVEGIYYVGDNKYRPTSLTLNVTLRDNGQLSASEPVMTQFDFIKAETTARESAMKELGHKNYASASDL